MKIVLIGTGMVAETHLHAVCDAPQVTLLGVMGRNSQKTEVFAHKAEQVLGYDVEVFPNASEIASDDRVSGVIIATPPDARHDLVTALSAAGKPILMEKPIERTLDAARQIVEMCDQSTAPLAIVLQHRARAASRHLKAAIEDGVLGDIATVDIKVPWWREQSYYDAPGRGSYQRDGGGAMISQAIHTLDLALWMLGPMATVQAMMRQTPLHRLEAEDWAGAVFEMTNGAVGTLNATTAAFPGTVESITIQGTKAAAHLASGVLTLSYLDGPTETFGKEATTGSGADPMAFTHAWHQAILEDFAKTTLSGEEPIASGKSALKAHAVIEAMQRSSASGNREKVTQL